MFRRKPSKKQPKKLVFVILRKIPTMLRWTPAFLLLLSMNLSAQCPCMDLQNDEDESVNFMTSLDQSFGFEEELTPQQSFFPVAPPPEQNLETQFQTSTPIQTQISIEEIEQELDYEPNSGGNGVKTVIVITSELMRKRKKVARKGMKKRKKVRNRRGACPRF